MSFREISYSMRGLIWLMTSLLLSSVLFWASVESNGGDISGSTIFMGVVAALSFVWAFWASFSAHKPLKK